MEGQAIRVLVVEDSDADAKLMISHLEAQGYKVKYHRVYSAEDMEEAISREPWDLVLCDYSLPSFSVGLAIELLKNKRLDLPFIVVSGIVGENAAVEVMKAGAHDFIVKNNFARLAPAIHRELREAEARAQRAIDMEKMIYLAAIVDSTGEAIFSQTMDGVITTWNSGAAELFGYAADEVVGKPASIIIPESLQKSTAEVFEDLRKGQPIEPFETVRVGKGGANLEVYVAISPIKTPEGKLLGASSISYDITERKKIEADRTRMIEQLNDTLSKVKTLRGLLPICAQCKKIRDDKGYWQKLETFVHEHSDAEFSHSICPDCMEKLYPDFARHQK
jgi:PAS domain S-box-containing protein